MITAGIDVGALTAKAVVLDFDMDRPLRQTQGRPLGRCLMPTGASPEQAGGAVLVGALEEAGLEAEAIQASVGTGYGRGAVQGVDWRITEISCHARGAWHLMPDARTVIDLGGQDAKAICLDEAGWPLDFEMNDRCAAGTGRFLEVMAAALDVELEELAALAAGAETTATLSSTCTVFAESEVISLLAESRDVAEIAAGLCETIAQRTLQMTNRLQVRPEVVLCGGVALNAGVHRAMERALDMRIVVPPEPQLVGALGAAILAGERAA